MIKIDQRIFVVLFILSYLTMLIGGGLLKPGYSHISQYISELNAVNTPNAALIGWFGFIPFGVFGLLLLSVTSKYVPLKGFSRIGYWLLMAEPIAYIGSAFAPCDVGCPTEGSQSQLIHNTLGAITYLFTTIGLIIISLSSNLSGKMRALWLVLAIVWFGLFSLMLEPSFSEWRGIIQRLAEWIVYGVLTASAWHFLARAKPQSL